MPIRWKLEVVLKARGMTGYQLAQATGISRQTIYKLIRQEEVARVDGETLAALCRALDCQPGDLLEHKRK